MKISKKETKEIVGYLKKVKDTYIDKCYYKSNTISRNARKQIRIINKLIKKLGGEVETDEED